MALKMRIRPRFPTNVQGANGISASLGGGVVTVTSNWGSLTAKSTITAAERDNVFLVGYDSEGAPTNSRVSVDTLLTTIGSGLDATLVSIGSLSPAANEGVYFSGPDTASTYTLTALARAQAAVSTYTAHGIVLGNSASAFVATAAMAAGQLLVGQSTSVAPVPTTIAGAIALSAAGTATLASAASWTLKGNSSSTAVSPTDFKIGSLTVKGSPAATDRMMLQDEADSGSLKYATVTSLAAANTIEGSWTPTIVGSSVAGTGQTYTLQVGSYEKTGRQVSARFNLSFTGVGTAAGNANIGGLPFANNSATSDFGIATIPNYIVAGLAASHVGIGGVVFAGSSTIVVTQFGSASTQALTLAQVGSTSTLNGIVTYRV